MSDTENIQDLINERNNQNKRIEQLVLEIERLKDIINQKESMYDNLAVSYRLSQEEIEQLRTELNTKDNIINYIRQIFKDGCFEDGCDCIKIYDYLKQLKEDK